MSYPCIFGLIEELAPPAYPRPEVLSPGCVLEPAGKVLKYTDTWVKPLLNHIRGSRGRNLGTAIENNVFQRVLKWSQGWEPLL